jgi:hypothetical protein
VLGANWLAAVLLALGVGAVLAPVAEAVDPAVPLVGAVEVDVGAVCPVALVDPPNRRFMTPCAHPP